MDNLLASWQQLKSGQGMSTPGTDSTTLHKIDLVWFEKASQALISGTFKYPRKRPTFISKAGSDELRSLTLTSPRIKIIERAILNSIEPHFEGVWVWREINKDLWEKFNADENCPSKTIKRNATGCYQKV